MMLSGILFYGIMSESLVPVGIIFSGIKSVSIVFSGIMFSGIVFITIMFSGIMSELYGCIISGAYIYRIYIL